MKTGLATRILACPHCGGNEVVRNGFTLNGKRKYLCHACSRQSFSPNGHTDERHEEILYAYEEPSLKASVDRIKQIAKFILLGCLAFILYGVATSSGAGWLYVISASLAGVLGVSALFALWSARSIEVTRRAPLVGTAGEPLSCTLEVRNTGRFTRTLLEIEDYFAGDTGRAVAAQVKPGALDASITSWRIHAGASTPVVRCGWHPRRLSA